jgi:cellulose synthase/poly-beta-1,6-N-acetylglucosamine synthase-like glycosyltransferase/peptidoglycan/xylan/chitin deacetylase (PgdA/CDA1 family)/spore germination protein YaaH
MAKQVFFDPERKRWRRVRTVFDLLGIGITVVVIVFVYSIIRHGQLPDLLLPDQHRPYRALKQNERAARKEALKRRAAARKKRLPTSPDAVTGDGLRAAYYVIWDAGSLSSLKEYHSQIDLLFPEWLHVITHDGTMTAVSGENKPFNVVANGKVNNPDSPDDPQRSVMQVLKQLDAQTEVLPLVNNFDPVSKKWMSEIGDFLNDPEARANFRRQLAALMKFDRYGGLCVDFEEIPLSAQPGFIALMQEVSQDLHARKLKLYVNVPVDDKDYDYKSLAATSDGVIFMMYDEHHSGSRPGPVAAQNWFVNNLNAALKDVPREKIMVAIGNYGYEWGPKGKQIACDSGEKASACTLTVQQAWLKAHDSEETVEFDPDSLNPHFSFLDDAPGSRNDRRDVWFLDAVTATNQMHAAQQHGVNAFALWRLGGEDRSLWQTWDDPSAPNAAEKLKVVPPGQDVDLEGDGEILRIEQRPTPGERSASVDSDTGMIVSETLRRAPLPYMIAQYGRVQKKVAITFDDGPDQKFTPQILDVLKREDVKATFFVIGTTAENNVGLLKRIYAEGHEIGNHTFTHPDISNIGRGYLDFELNLTERLLASKLGVKPLFFRAPYSIDQEPDTAEQVVPLEAIQARGYITIGDKIDPNDWRNPAPSPEEIVNDVLEQTSRGNVILLHDGGGDRTNTVKALPLVIRALREKGFEIVPVSELMGKTRTDVMPPIAPNERFTAVMDGIAFLLWGLLTAAIVRVFWVGDILMTARMLFVGTGAVIDRFRRIKKMAPKLEDCPRVAVLIPAYNEEKVIERTIRSVLNSSYRNVRIIVIDDGSKDRTAEVARATFRQEIAQGKLLVLQKSNAGKAAAANFGLAHVQEEIFIAIDADTVIHSDAIAYMVPHFADPKLAAVAGNAKVGNRINMWTRWQALEYVTSQNFERRALNTVNAVSVVPGAIGAWRTAAVKEVGMYPFDTVAEDADLTMSLLQAGYKVHYEDRALAYTEAPVNARGLMRQRFRWSFGILQAVWKHRAAFLRGGSLGWIALPNILVFQILLPLVSPFIDLMFAVGAISYLIDKHFHPRTAQAENFERLALFFVAFLVIDFMTAAIAFFLERSSARSPEDKWLLSQVWLQRFAYRQIFSWVLFKTLKRAIDGRSFDWDKLERTASVTHA